MTSVLAQSGSDPMDWLAIGLLCPVMVAAGAAIVEIGRRGRDGRLKRNAFAGIRTAATMRSDEAWAAAHRAGARTMMTGGAVSVVTGLALLLRPSNTVGGVVVVGGAVVMTALVVVSGIQGGRAAKAVGD